MLFRVKPEQELLNTIQNDVNKPLYWYVSNAFSSFLQSYTRAMNKVYSRTGPLFENPFKRIEAPDESYFSALVAYIHKNPLKHKIEDDFMKYPYSSYLAHLNDSPTKLMREEVLSWFWGRDGIKAFHTEENNQQIDNSLVLE